MANLKDLKNRISSVKSTQKITKAMKMVAASKLKRAQERAEAARPYTEKMERMLAALATKADPENSPALLSGRRDAAGDIADKNHLIIAVTSDRGLCGGLNSSLVRAIKQKITEMEGKGKLARLMIVGKKGWEQLKHGYENNVSERIDTSSQAKPEYVQSEAVANQVITMFEAGDIDSCSVVYNKFESALTQKVTFQQLIPLEMDGVLAEEAEDGVAAVYEYEPGEEEILSALLPRNIAVQIFHAQLENAASEQGARMTAMDNATRNAGEMIKDLTLQYNRTRQAAITTELTEIISGAEAL